MDGQLVIEWLGQYPGETLAPLTASIVCDSEVRETTEGRDLRRVKEARRQSLSWYDEGH